MCTTLLKAAHLSELFNRLKHTVMPLHLEFALNCTKGVPCRAVLCCAVPCCAVLCCAVLCCAVLCCDCV